MHRQMEVSVVLSIVSNTLQDDSFLENLDESVEVKLPSRNVAEMSATYKRRYYKTNPY